ncbi:alpha/beta-hydrolase [Mollisia scopiformis]|uniref:Alpha/beta-hydrolase n=1 Tax=Mollisia scopiformis TaxID=149040 RepID=A0A194X2P2_MOLSC|nr:alpha/beta-hydrolase [Mollisia scopiformis]KUJ14453.1 alpha/beta-hydrolase [Mollisia scopiformis]
MEPKIPAPPYDEELAKTLSTLNFPVTITPDLIPAIRARPPPTLSSLLAPHPTITHTSLSIPGPLGPIPLSLFRSSSPSSNSNSQPHPTILWFHGGGFFSGHPFTGLSNLLPFTTTHNALIATPTYRLAPEFPDPAPLNDCYAALLYLSSHPLINPHKIMLAGSSAGAGLAAGVALFARDHAGPKIEALMLQAPMLDDRLKTASSWQFVDSGTFSRGSAEMGWGALLGERRGAEGEGVVSGYAAPGREGELGGLPEVFCEVGSAEVFRDEVVQFVDRIWRAGGKAELHVWAGAFHRWQAFAPEARVSVEADGVRGRWIGMVLGR